MNLGIGKIGDSAPVFRRKMRWTLSAEFKHGEIKQCFTKVRARPGLNIQETDLKATNVAIHDDPATVTTTHYDLTQEMISWLSGFYSNEDNGVAIENNPERHGTVYLRLYHACGTLVETWKLVDAFPSNVIFLELDHSLSETMDIEIVWKYKDAKLTFPDPNPPLGP